LSIHSIESFGPQANRPSPGYWSFSTVMLHAGRLTWTVVPTLPSDWFTGGVQTLLRESSYCAFP
jgi:hypothetical protein